MECEPAEVDVDFSIIRDPVFTSVRSMEDYVNVMAQGTPELRRILAEECDVILECKVCQSLFRSLPNFIAHKRIYCIRKFGGYLPSVPMHITEDETVVIEPADPDDDGGAGSQDTVHPLFESVLDGSFVGTSEAYKVYTDALLKEQTLVADRDTNIVTLDSIPGNSNAMFQTVDTYQAQELTDEDISRIRARKRAQKNVDNICNKIVKVDPQPATHSHVKVMLRNRKTTETDDEGGMKSESASPKKSARKTCGEWKKKCNLKTMSCEVCNSKYSCLKTLRFHVENIHQEQRKFFPCTLCNALFSQIWGVRRHVERTHHKTYEQWLRMSENVKKKAFLVPVDQLDENGRPKNYERKKKTMATKFKERAVANLKKTAAAAAKTSARTITKHSTVSPSGQNEDTEKAKSTASPASRSSSGTRTIRKIVKKKSEGSLKSSPTEKPSTSPSAKSSKEPTLFHPSPGKVLKVRVTPIKVVDHKGESASTSPAGSTTSTSSGRKFYKCYNCNQKYDIKGSLNKHLNRGRCFKPTPAPLTPERSPKDGSAAKREALASVLSPKQLRKVNSLMDTDNIRCIQCKKQFTALILLSRHVIRHLGIVRYKCKFCLYKSFNQGECMKHVRNSHKKNDAHKFVMNIDIESDDTKMDASCRGLSEENPKFSGKKSGSSGIVKQLVRPKSPGASGASSSGDNSLSSNGTPTFNLSAAKRLFASTSSQRPGEESADTKPLHIKEEPSSPTSSPSAGSCLPGMPGDYRPASVTRSNSICSTSSDAKPGSDRKQPGIDSSNIKDPNYNKYNISTRNSPREFDTKPYLRVDGMTTLMTRHGVYQKPKLTSQDSSGCSGSSDEEDKVEDKINKREENASKKKSDDLPSKSKADGYTTIKNSTGMKTPPRDSSSKGKTTEQIKREKDNPSTKKLLEEIFG